MVPHASHAAQFPVFQRHLRGHALAFRAQLALHCPPARRGGGGEGGGGDSSEHGLHPAHFLYLHLVAHVLVLVALEQKGSHGSSGGEGGGAGGGEGDGEGMGGGGDLSTTAAHGRHPAQSPCFHLHFFSHDLALRSQYFAQSLSVDG